MAGFRTLVINKRCKLESRLGYLVIRSTNETRVHISEIENLILESTAIAITTALLSDLSKAGVNIIFCDNFHLPCSAVLPLSLNYNLSSNIQKQVLWNKTVKDNCWMMIVKEKIRQQSFVLNHVNRKDSVSRLLELSDLVQPGDPNNQEGLAARIYFREVFGCDFSRDNSSKLENKMLNYGYSILMATVSREIAASGYLNAIGIWHKRADNPYNFACDLMEPFRPLIDYMVFSIPVAEEDNYKHYLIDFFDRKVLIDGNLVTSVYALRCYIRKVINFLNGDCCELCKLQYVIENEEL